MQTPESKSFLRLFHCACERLLKVTQAWLKQQQQWMGANKPFARKNLLQKRAAWTVVAMLRLSVSSVQE
jgi:hypothetical protein